MDRSLPLLLTAIILGAFSSAGANDGAKRKPGLWEARVEPHGVTVVWRVCIDAATEARLN
jgi:hypothetical protein